MSNQPPCNAWVEKLALRREDLSQAEREALDAHVAYCSICQRVQADYDFLDAGLKTLFAAGALSDLSFELETQNINDESEPEIIFYNDVAEWQPRRNKRDARETTSSSRRGKKFALVMVASILIGFILVSGMYNAVTNTAHPSGTTLFIYRQHKDFVSSVAWSPNGKYIATGSWDHTVQVWNAHSGVLITRYTGHQDFVSSIAWSPDGEEIASGSWDHTVQVWNPFTGQTLFTYTGHRAEVSTVAWSPDGEEIASGSWDHTVQVWNPFTGQHLLTYTGHHDFVNTLAWSPDGKEIASGGSDITVQIWDARTGVIRFIYEDDTTNDPIITLACSPNEKKIAFGGRTPTVKL